MVPGELGKMWADGCGPARGPRTVAGLFWAALLWLSSSAPSPRRSLHLPPSCLPAGHPAITSVIPAPPSLMPACRPPCCHLCSYASVVPSVGHAEVWHAFPLSLSRLSPNSSFKPFICVTSSRKPSLDCLFSFSPAVPSGHHIPNPDMHSCCGFGASCGD